MPGASRDPRPWLATVNRMLNTKGTRFWYSARKPMMTKNEKCASMEPPERATRSAQHAERPAVTNSDPAVRCPRVSRAPAAVTAGISATPTVSGQALPVANPKIASPGHSDASTARRNRCRRPHCSSSTRSPRGR